MGNRRRPRPRPVRLVPGAARRAHQAARRRQSHAALLGITNWHDGTGACALRATAVRIVCANAFRVAELEGERTRVDEEARNEALTGLNDLLTTDE